MSYKIAGNFSMFELWFHKILKVNKELADNLIWTLDHHPRILLIDKKGNFAWPKHFDPISDNPNDDKLHITNRIIIGPHIPIKFYRTGYLL